MRINSFLMHNEGDDVDFIRESSARVDLDFKEDNEAMRYSTEEKKSSKPVIYVTEPVSQDKKEKIVNKFL